jgi:sugar O-acyltransferase (sialic acid O-acetyltransferase NeuD family)
MEEKIGLLGAGGQADETISFESKKSLAFLAVNSSYISRDGMIDIEDPEQEHVLTDVIAAVGAPAVKKKLVETWRGENYTNVISEESYIDPSVSIGKGCIVGPRSVITTNVEIGDHVLINIAATISHDCSIGNFATISPGAHIGGRVSIGDGAFVGIGAVISNDVKIARGVVIGAGAVLVDDASVENGVYVGVPATLLKTNDGWLSEI